MTHLNCNYRVTPYQPSTSSSYAHGPSPAHHEETSLDLKGIASESRIISHRLKKFIADHPQALLIAHKATIIPELQKLELRDLFEVLLEKDSFHRYLSLDTISQLLPSTLSLDNVITFLETIVPQFFLPLPSHTGDNTHIIDNELSYHVLDYETDVLLTAINPRPVTYFNAAIELENGIFRVIVALIDRAISSLQPISSPQERAALSTKLCRLLKIQDKEGNRLCFIITENCCEPGMDLAFKLIGSLFALLEFKELKEIIRMPKRDHGDHFFKLLTRKEIWKIILELKSLQTSEERQHRTTCVTSSLPTTIPFALTPLIDSYLGDMLSEPLFELLTLNDDLPGNYLFHSLLKNVDRDTNKDFKNNTIIPLLKTPNLLGNYVVHHCLKDARSEPSVASSVINQLMYIIPINELLDILRLKDSHNKSVIHHFPADSAWEVEPETPMVVEKNPHTTNLTLWSFAQCLLNLCNLIVTTPSVDSKKLANFLNATGMDPNRNTILGIIINYSSVQNSLVFYRCIIEILGKLETADLDDVLTRSLRLNHLKRPITLETLFIMNKENATKVLRKVSPKVQESIFSVYPSLRLF